MQHQDHDNSIRFGLDKSYEFHYQGKKVFSFCKMSRYDYLIATEKGIDLIHDGNIIETIPISVTYIKYIPELEIIIAISTGIPYIVFISNRRKHQPSPVKFRLTISIVKNVEYCNDTNMLIVNGSGIEGIFLKSIYKMQAEIPTITVETRFIINNPLLGSHVFVDHKKQRFMAMTNNGYKLYNFRGDVIKDFYLTGTTIKSSSTIFYEKARRNVPEQNEVIIDAYKRLLTTDIEGNTLLFHSSGKLLKSFLVANRQIDFTQFINSEFVICVFGQQVQILDVKTELSLFCIEFDYTPTQIVYFDGPTIGFLVDGNIQIFEIVMPWELFQRDSSQSISMKRYNSYDDSMPGRIVKLSESGIVSLVSPANGFLLGSCTSKQTQVVRSVLYDRGCIYCNGIMEYIAANDRIFIILENGFVDLFCIVENNFVHIDTLRWSASKIMLCKFDMNKKYGFAVFNKHNDLVAYNYHDFSLITRKKFDYRKFLNAFYNSNDNLICAIYNDTLVVYSTYEMKVTSEHHIAKPLIAAMENSKLVLVNQNHTISFYEITKEKIFERATMNMSEEVTSISIDYGIFILITKSNTVWIGNEHSELTKIFIPFNVHCACVCNRNLDLLVCIDRNIMKVNHDKYKWIQTDLEFPEENDSIENESLLNDVIVFNNAFDYYITEPHSSSRRSSRRYQRLQSAIDEYRKSHRLTNVEEEEEEEENNAKQDPRKSQKNLINRDAVLKEMYMIEASFVYNPDLLKKIDTMRQEKEVEEKPVEEEKLPEKVEEKKEEEEQKYEELKEISVKKPKLSKKKHKKKKHKKEKVEEKQEQPKKVRSVLGNTAVKRRQRSQSQSLIDRASISIEPIIQQMMQNKPQPPIPRPPNRPKITPQSESLVSSEGYLSEELSEFDSKENAALVVRNNKGEIVQKIDALTQQQKARQRFEKRAYSVRTIGRVNPIVKTKIINIPPNKSTEQAKSAEQSEIKENIGPISLISDSKNQDDQSSFSSIANENELNLFAEEKKLMNNEKKRIKNMENLDIDNDYNSSVTSFNDYSISDVQEIAKEQSNISAKELIDFVDNQEGKIIVKEPDTLKSNPRKKSNSEQTKSNNILTSNVKQKSSSETKNYLVQDYEPQIKPSQKRRELIKQAIDDNRRLNNSVNSDYSISSESIKSQQSNETIKDEKLYIDFIPQIPERRRIIPMIVESTDVERRKPNPRTDMTVRVTKRKPKIDIQKHKRVKEQKISNTEEIKEIVNKYLSETKTSASDLNIESIEQIFSRSGRKLLITREDLKKLLENMSMININYGTMKKPRASKLTIVPQKMKFPQTLSLPKLKNGDKSDVLVESDSLSESDSDEKDINGCLNDSFSSTDLNGPPVQDPEDFVIPASKTKQIETVHIQIDDEQRNIDGSKRKKPNYI